MDSIKQLVWNRCCHNCSFAAYCIRVVDIHIVNDNSNNDVIIHSTIRLRQGTHVTILPRFPSRFQGFQAFTGTLGPAINIWLAQ